MKYSQEALAMTAEFEGLRLTSYQDTGGVWTIGYGHTKGVKQGMTITKEQALQFLIEDIAVAEKIVSSLVKVPLTQGQYDALVDFVFNVGEGAFARSTMLRLLNTRNYEGAGYEFPKWIFDNGHPLTALADRRKVELKRYQSQV